MADGYPTRSLRELTRVLFSRLVGTILILVVVVAAVVAATLLARWRYRSRALLLARPLTPLARVEGPASLRDRLSLFVVTQRELVRSDHVIASALMKMETGAGRIAPDGPVGPDGQKWYSEAAVAKYAAANAREVNQCRPRIRVETPGGPDVTFTQTFTVTVDWPEERSLAKALGEGDSRAFAARRAQEFAAHLLSAYQARRADVEKTHAQQSTAYLLQQVTAVAKNNLDTARKALTDFISTELKDDPVLAESLLSGIGEIGSQNLSTRFKADISLGQAKLKQLDALEAELNKEFAKGDAAKIVVPTTLLATNPSLAKILDGIAGLRLTLNSLAQQYTDEYEKIKQAKAELAANLKDLGEELQVMVRQERAALQAELKQFQDDVDREKKIVSQLSERSPEYKQRKATFANAQAIYDRRQADAIDAQSAEALAAVPVEVRVVDRPSRPDPKAPHRPILWLNIVVGVVAGLVLSLIYAFLADHFDHSVKGMDDAERHVGVDVLASVPRFRGRMVRAK